MGFQTVTDRVLALLGCVTLLTAGLSGVSAIDCFKCVSHSGDNPACEDPFHHNYTSEILHQPCLAGRKGREGLFPATACVKITGTYAMSNPNGIKDLPVMCPKHCFGSEDTGDTIVVRTCALDSGTLTVDTELVRMSHCGSFYFDDRYVRGCIVSCAGDACNAARSRYYLALSYLVGAPQSYAGLTLVTYVVLCTSLHSFFVRDRCL
ncbi:uncharacterized protein LOC111273656 isoform X1 [Varroa jacobsoni]|uniref:uncharacterized protein LOC111273656 isoform X1 n=1 Tax=Varroa jacobsoni TaxID=62625 RepID=UPI000BF3CB45|nr:uncharacterized protein LOC111273656 isoform X1 [Varroa jacobsoni]XP_022711182.1 uncharacterized protein LOC111273656 isoform X1 [Varroa jacobsoni]XP_022711183.1 uncharacterized protein LOC111273656 isoform X1 [Varroa jacobsoni]XP_022711184.1 uncharacterized protein LOC111273656 isoform X1 [Varroa jacobsoni]XP_022711185.1 uncharacterized protein LOC111273656 isoform X1 [Varroa jacobsoni]XP_022711187.1 uncharacterized protein LOC111273656 isoform X1 [Varroa jacobsoni]XP_022711188.1 uncharac